MGVTLTDVVVRDARRAGPESYQLAIAHLPLVATRYRFVWRLVSLVDGG